MYDNTPNYLKNLSADFWFSALDTSKGFTTDMDRSACLAKEFFL